MMKYLFCLLIFVGQVSLTAAQSVQDTLLVVPGKESLYFYHVVTKGETLYGVARNYHLEPETLAAANNLTLTTPLKLFQILKIPLDNSNLVQTDRASLDGLTPLYHKVIKGETLYRVSQLHDKVDPALLKKWNHLENNDVKPGQFLVVGWLNAGLANRAQASSPEKAADTPTTGEANKAKMETAVAESKPAGKVAEKTTPPAVAAGNAGTSATASGGSFLSEVIASENRNRRKTAPVVSTAKKSPAADTPAAAGGNDAFSVDTQTASAPAAPQHTSKKEDKPVEDKTVAEVMPDAPKPVAKKSPDADSPFAKMLDKVTHKPQPAATEKPVDMPNPQTDEPAAEVAAPATTSGGDQSQPVIASKTVAPVSETSLSDSLQLSTDVKSEFEQEYNQQTGNDIHVEEKKGAAGWFKSNVKPGSGRYYALCNDVPRGTVVKVINPISGKYILAKVLDAIPKQKENYNLIVKLSDAAMEDLGITQSRFWCEIHYAKGQGK